MNCKFEDLEGNVTWCKDRIYKKDIEYIRKDAIVDYLKNHVIPSEKETNRILNDDPYTKGKIRGYEDILNDIVNDLI